MKFTTGLVRLSYAHLFKPYAPASGGEAKYSAALLIPKKDKKTLDRLQKALEEVKAAPYNTKRWADRNGKIGNIDLPLRDGDVDKAGDPVYKGMYYMNAKANEDRPPKVVDRDRVEITDPDEVYSGCWAQAVVTFFGYNANGHKGIGVGLAAIRKMTDGDRLGGTAVTDDDFADDLIDSSEISDDDLLI